MQTVPSGRRRRRVLTQLWFWVVIAIGAGAVFGLVAPDTAKEAKWLADAFLQLVKTITAPVIFLTVVIGIASLGDMSKAGGLALRALAYFFCATVVALGLGLLAGNLIAPGSGFDAGPTATAAEAANEKIAEAGATGHGLVGFITESLIPTSFVQPFVENEVLKVLVLGDPDRRGDQRARARRCGPASWAASRSRRRSCSASFG